MLQVINCRQTKVKELIEHLYTLPVNEEVLLVLWSGSIVKKLPKEHIRVLSNIKQDDLRLIDHY